MTTFPLKDGRFRARDGGKGAKATHGSRHTLTVSAKDAAGEEVSSSIKLAIARKTAGSRSGAPIGC